MEKEQNHKVFIAVCLNGGVCGKEPERGGLVSDYSQVESCMYCFLHLLGEAALMLEAWESNLVAGEDVHKAQWRAASYCFGHELYSLRCFFSPCNAVATLCTAKLTTFGLLCDHCFVTWSSFF